VSCKAQAACCSLIQNEGRGLGLTGPLSLSASETDESRYGSKITRA
jgi:hypothetical protein